MLKRLRRAEALDIPGERLELRLADQFPRQWINAFVPEASRRAARKQCISGRRHVGFLWQAFTLGFIDGRTGDEAEAAWRAQPPEAALLFLPDEGLLYRVPGALELPGHVVLTDPVMTRTFLRTADGRRFYATVYLS